LRILEQSTTHASATTQELTALSSLRFLAAAVLAASLTAPVAAFAQQSPPAAVPGQPGAHHGRHHNAFRTALRGLNLNAAQKSQIDQVFAQARGQNRGADPATRKANRAKLRSQVEAILTPAQRTQLRAALQQARRQHQPA
jgi:Spy/CpxP family protein refolding chaperone